jgi:2-(1,2-epoxy-1,2-dihydrophenyl)acetyl-CoA isomerase
MALAFQEKLDECNHDLSIRAVVIQGSGKAFCAGQDLQEAIDPNGPGLPVIVAEHYNPIILKIRQLQKPVIAAVNGVAAGAGANIALACDFCLAKKSASFIQAFSKIGLIPDSAGTFFLPRLIGMAKSTALMMLGDKLSAEEAERIGLIYQAVDDETFDESVQALATRLATMPTRGLWLTKKALNESWSNDLSKQLLLEGELQEEAGKTHDYTEGVNAFLEKRKPVFKGD